MTTTTPADTVNGAPVVWRSPFAVVVDHPVGVMVYVHGHRNATLSTVRGGIRRAVRTTARETALQDILDAWATYDTIGDAAYQARNVAAAAVLGQDAADALSTITTREKWSPADAATTAATPADVVALLRRLDAHVAQ